MIAPQLAHDAKGDLGVVPPGWAMEPKLDGWRFIVAVEADGLRAWSGRNAREVSGNVPCLAPLLNLPEGTVLDGEMIPTDDVAIATHLANGKQNLRYVAFDVLKLNGSDVCHLPWHQRRELLERIGLEIEGSDERCSITPVWDVDPKEFANWLALGFEGAVCKNPDAPYRPGKRSRDWLKVKPQSTTEATVVGWERGKGKHNQHEAGALRVRLHETDQETTCGYCVPIEDAEKMVGRIIELRHHGFTVHGKVRHPIFSRIREDLE